MEEIAHIFLRHKPSKLSLGPGGMTMRTYNKSNETQAYWVGAAALVPRAVLFQGMKDGESVREIASQQQVSTDLIEFRLKTSGLWKDWNLSRSGG